MKIIIFEYVHFQYALTITELFKNHEITYVLPSGVEEAINKFDPEFNLDSKWIYEKETFSEKVEEIISRINKEQFDLLFINPIFENFEAFAKIAKEVKCKKTLTTHNINNWFRQKYRSPKGLKEKKLKERIIDNCDYIAVEDFIFQYLKEDEPRLFNAYKFIYSFHIVYGREEEKC